MQTALPLAAALPAVWAAAGRGGATVRTSFGDLLGRALPGGVEEFLGVPFATAARWGDPTDWAEPWPAPRRALTAGPGCGPDSAHSAAGFAEDCLYLNVWRSTAPGPLPVLVFVFGGAFHSGEASEWDCSVLAAKHPGVYVTINYRLGALGWLPVAPGAANFGLRDQQSALRWVRREAAAFGGDAARTLLFGESAGAMCVLLHLVSPPSAGLFARAASESGMPSARPRAAYANATRGFFAAMACAAGDLACLRARPLSRVQRASDAVFPPGGDPYTRPGHGWGPVVDGVSVPADPVALLRSGALSNPAAPVLLGVNTDEGAGFAYPYYPGGMSADQYRAFVPAVLGAGRPELAPPAAVHAVLRAYPPAAAGADNRPVAGALLGDRGFICGTRRAARLLAARAGAAAVYRYRFAHAAGGAAAVGHGAELAFVFDHGDWTGAGNFTAAEAGFAGRVGAAWAHFAATGAPPPAERWAPYDSATDNDAVLTPAPVWAAEDGWRAGLCDLWDSLEEGAGP